MTTHPGCTPGGADPLRRTAGADPFRRTCDRVQCWLGRVLLALVVVGLPVASAAAGIQAYRAQLHAGQAQSATRHAVTAQLTSDVGGTSPPDGSKVPATAAWTASDGTLRTTTVRVWPGEEAGTSVRLWVDSRDRVVPAPVTHSRAVAGGWTAATAAAAAGSVLGMAVWRGTVRLLDRHRYAQWDAEWSQVEPYWSKRLPN
ncbi:hypothetical protein [Kitasatospora sp. NPDC047058]|uniref:Rv1733c family protein n=1 Tax=Kitasatospora sp. NPDC047058 TaxID=3155620 RepID=UPI0033F3D341